MDPKIGMKRQALLLLLYNVTGTVTSILTVVKLEGAMSAHWALVFVPIWICAATHCISIIHVAVKRSVFEIREVATLLLTTCMFLLLSMHLGDVQITWPVIAIPVWLLLGFYLFEVLYTAK
jgi:hypothetical protein